VGKIILYFFTLKIFTSFLAKMAQFGRDLDTASIRIISSEIVEKHTVNLYNNTETFFQITQCHKT
jgi:hypothetical protein